MSFGGWLPHAAKVNKGKTVLAQILSGLGGEEFARCARRYPMSRDTPALSAYDHFATMVFAQLTYRESLRDIEACLRSRRHVLYHAGIRGEVKRCNLAYANEHRDARLFADVTTVLMRRAQRLYAAEPSALSLDGDLFAIDATLIDLSLALFPWARWQGTQAAVKLNVMLAVASDLPTFCTLVPGTRHDVHFLDEISMRPGNYYCLDRGYVDYARLHRFTGAKAWFVTRAKSNTSFYVCVSRAVDEATGVRCDQLIKLNGPKARRDYPAPLRRIRYYDTETRLTLVFLTNNFDLPALTIALIYRHRWRIELFSSGSNNTFACADSSRTIPTASPSKSGPRSALTCSSRSSAKNSPCRTVFTKFCKSSRFPHWRKCLSQSYLKKLIQQTSPLILIAS